MTEQKRIRPSDRRKDDTVDEAKRAPRSSEELKAETDELLDEIDALLDEQGLNSETEAQDFVDSFIQKGGE